ncbi:MAG: anthranilate phosphoribosyltransferase [Gammaproteobacteria bacterium RIFCSPHIGHO2_12_FULL_41_15]|nr:MAG: anthranilate phosphoribosyltransferase [Gammaproteobacteria bacterium RIFCSPHIGHO2_12_FULL_41_15]
MLTVLLNKLMLHKHLTAEECMAALTEMSQRPVTVKAAAFLTLLHTKKETVEELLGFIKKLKESMLPITSQKKCLDIVGTGGDGFNTVNISTLSSLVTASLGVPTAKHGNRSVSSLSGSADFIEALGIPLTISPNQAEQALQEMNFTFLYAPHFHPMLQLFKELRQELGVRTTFNLLGPLLNPAQPHYYVMGVYRQDLLALFATLLTELNVERALVVHSQGLDEISLLGPSDIYEINDREIKKYSLDPKEFGFQYCRIEDLQGGNAEKNKNLILHSLQKSNNPIKNTIILNAGCGLYAAKKAETLAQGIALVKQHLETDHFLQYLEKLIAYCQNIGENHEQLPH